VNWTRIAGTSAFVLGLGLLDAPGVGGSARAQPQADAPAPTPVSTTIRDDVPQIEFDQVDGRITLHTNQVDVRRLFEVVSRRTGLSLAISPRVQGTIIADFEKVTIQELLDAVLKMANLVEKVDGGIHFIYSREEVGESVREEVPADQPRSAPSAPSRRPALGRLLGKVGGRRNVAVASGSEIVPLVVEQPAATASTAEPVLLDVGSQLGAMSAGRLAPGAASLATPPKPKADPAVAAAGFHVDSAAAAAKAADRRLTVRDGETFESLAKTYYGSPRFARALWWANRTAVAWPGALAAGKQIVIPPTGDLDRKMLGAHPPATVPAALPTLERITASANPAPRSDPQVQPASLSRSAGAARAVEGGVAIHVVGPGDTIRKIAVACFGDDSRAYEIAELNRELLQVDGRPRVGQRLILPAGANPP